ncbi:MAG: DNA methyltransferase [Candidatus Thorarchaeota archaeon]
MVVTPRNSISKPEALLERIIASSSDQQDIVADFFVGSGTTVIVADRLNRRWFACDSSEAAINVAKKRLIQNDNT